MAKDGDITFMDAGDIKIGSFVMINNHPCKIVETNWSKPGKHGSAKIMYVGVDIFNNTKHQTFNPTGTMVEVPVVSKIEYTLIDISNDDYLTMMDSSGINREDLKLPEDNELATRIKSLFNSKKEVYLMVQGAIGIEQVIDAKESYHKN
jgi:translation initiation factor 5A